MEVKPLRCSVSRCGVSVRARTSVRYCVESHCQSAVHIAISESALVCSNMLANCPKGQCLLELGTAVCWVGALTRWVGSCWYNSVLSSAGSRRPLAIRPTIQHAIHCAIEPKGQQAYAFLGGVGGRAEGGRGGPPTCLVGSRTILRMFDPKLRVEMDSARWSRSGRT
jgi:hypothetical protein